MAGRTSSRLGGGLDLLGLGQRRRERPLRAQSGAGFEKAEIEGGASYAAQFAIGETLVKGLEIYRAAETVEETGSPYSASAPGVGRRLHLAFALSEGKCEALEGIVVDGEVLTGDAFVREADVAAGDGGGATYAATTARGGTLKVTSYLDAPEPDAERESGFVARGKTLRDASARMGSEALAWSAEHQGAGISWCHVELEQPVGKDRLVWDGVPELGFLAKGMHLQAPGGDASTLSEPSYTDSAAAVRYWWLRERRSAPADRIDMDTVRDAHVRTGQRIEVRVDETVRYAWLATAARTTAWRLPGRKRRLRRHRATSFCPSVRRGLLRTRRGGRRRRRRRRTSRPWCGAWSRCWTPAMRGLPGTAWSFTRWRATSRTGTCVRRARRRPSCRLRRRTVRPTWWSSIATRRVCRRGSIRGIGRTPCVWLSRRTRHRAASASRA